MSIDTALKDKVFSLLNFSFDGAITVKEGVNGVFVKYDGKDAEIGFSTTPQQARCYFLLSMHLKNGKTAFEISETPAFDTIGPMLDVSRGKAMKVDAIKRYIDIIVTLGMNTFMLYTEDMFEMEGYPMFGYQRSPYTVAELKEVDDYAFARGVEVIPCIQTLGHLASYLRWQEAAPIRNNSAVLLVGEEKTYAFIEQEIKTMRRAFRSKKIHLGMDEAFGVNEGVYEKRHGRVREEDVFYAHLERVLQLAGRYFDAPMIWSDMLFNNPDGIPYYDKFVLPQERVDNAPSGVSLVFWDYYHKAYAYYDTLLTQHKRFKNPVIFAGGLWTWDGITPNFAYTYDTMKPALKACLAHTIKDIIITQWLSGGAGADFMQTVPGLAIFSEYCYKGAACTEADIFAASEHIAGVDRDLFYAISDRYLGLSGARSFCKAVLYGDPLADFVKWDVDYAAAKATYLHSLEVLNAHPDYTYRDFFVALFEHGVCKLELYQNLQKAYKAGDRDYLKKAANEILPEAIAHFDAFYALFKKYWKRDYKAFDMMAYTHDLGGARLRMMDAVETIAQYLDGETDGIEELEVTTARGINKCWLTPTNYISNFR